MAALFRVAKAKASVGWCINTEAMISMYNGTAFSLIEEGHVVVYSMDTPGGHYAD